MLRLDYDPDRRHSSGPKHAIADFYGHVALRLFSVDRRKLFDRKPRPLFHRVKPRHSEGDFTFTRGPKLLDSLGRLAVCIELEARSFLSGCESDQEASTTLGAAG